MPIAAMVQDPFPLGQQGGLWRGHQGRTGQEGQEEEWVETACFSTCFLTKQSIYSLGVLHLLHPLCTLHLEGIIIRNPVGGSAERDDAIWEQESWQDLCRELGSRCLSSLSSPER